MDDDAHKPIRAQLFDDDALARLDAFVASLGESIDAIQDAEHGGRLDETRKRAADLARDGQELGLPQLAAAARCVVESCGSGDADRVYADILALTGVVRRVRLGHRGTL